jgi:hypothetical protein
MEFRHAEERADLFSAGFLLQEDLRERYFGNYPFSQASPWDKHDGLDFDTAAFAVAIHKPDLGNYLEGKEADEFRHGKCLSLIRRIRKSHTPG